MRASEVRIHTAVEPLFTSKKPGNLLGSVG